MIVEIEAKFACDDCGTEFFAPLDPACVPPAGWSIFAVAEDSVRGGIGYSDARDDEGVIGSGSVGYDGRHYCAKCTRKYDVVPDEVDPRFKPTEGRRDE